MMRSQGAVLQKRNAMISTERPSEANASRLSLGIKGRDTDCSQRIDRREVGPSSIPVSSATTLFTGILGRINSSTQARLCIKYVCNGHARPLIKISQYPFSADKKEIHILYLYRYQYTVLNNHEHITGEIFFN
jgi:hypothetical protein